MALLCIHKGFHFRQTFFREFTNEIETEEDTFETLTIVKWIFSPIFAINLCPFRVIALFFTLKSEKAYKKKSENKEYQLFL